jgi:hypothetical protein
MNSNKLFSGATFVLLVFLFVSFSISLYGDPGGRTGRTRKTSTSGCGSCHGSSATTGVSVTISGPDTVVAGQTNQFSMIINRAGKTGAGIDIATRRGTLAAVTSGTRVSNGEITHNDNLSMTNGTITILFNYIAPATAGLDTIWSTGLATNSNGGSSGDEWNWSANRQVYVKLPTGVNSTGSEIREFRLMQNFPNPFNPETVIRFDIPQAGNVALSIYDASGKKVNELVNEHRYAGSYAVTFSGGDLPSGVYYCRLEAGEYSQTMKMMLLK